MTLLSYSGDTALIQTKKMVLNIEETSVAAGTEF